MNVYCRHCYELVSGFCLQELDLPERQPVKVQLVSYPIVELRNRPASSG